ncbi:PIN domain-like protein [Lentinula aciculospora]|uniref:PIN domain-like protein n=1 Tax=Lentinula aciculospora TaxID=153920 RepID=A0A9W9DJ05_9AGAR|nr:PIN domain-like protein [Lentinula aciculospora]
MSNDLSLQDMDSRRFEPLPAKLGTEKEREKKKEQNVKRANELKDQGKESQAAELYAKCVDVTPQMAYQVIKALKVEKVQYIVAPYEADAQLAYLEHMGLVDGIITEDSDLLVFGCQNVHVKLDIVAATVVSISRADFGSPALAANSFSLVGWSEAQFRWMAMLSGCDYLPSICGVGIKTAYQLLKKYKAVDKAVKMIRLEGKKSIPKDYLDSFRLAEKVFLHQRVYDPRLQRLVYLAAPSNDLCLDEAAEMYIGRDLDRSTAIHIAEGDVCPISLADMEDINPTFVPNSRRPAKGLLLQNCNTNISRGPKDKVSDKKGGILGFLIAGNASGKRTLMDVMEQDIASKRKKLATENEAEWPRNSTSTSRFFSKSSSLPATSTSADASEKENIEPTKDTGAEILDDPVTQEDGYLSPSPSLSRAVTPDVSSPIVPYKQILRDDVGVPDPPFSQNSPSQEQIFV